jgi:predicted ester cyclase
VGRVPTIAREQLTSEYLGAWNSHDPDAVDDDRGAAEVARGRHAIRAHVAKVISAFPDLRFELVRVAHGDGFSAGEWRAEMTHRGELSGLAPTGRRASSAGVDVATLGDDDLITHLVSYYDGAAIMRDLGLLPRHGSRAERGLLRAASRIPFRF